MHDLLTIADEMNVERFSYYGYSWLALVGLQLAIRSDRVESLVMGGFPPLVGPYKEMLTVTNKTYQQASSNQNPCVADEQIPIDPEQVDWDNIQVQIDPNQTKQFVTMYEHLRNLMTWRFSSCWSFRDWLLPGKRIRLYMVRTSAV
ncbi:pimeloyl-ACP methyl ester carboxylesterase [Paenibacillus sp. PastF-1]|nr:pimeloyl-ACP methyl ester carboxylesterase [Paenibacillus sp. PastF-2]MDF9848069.1 pimeloyl-ACP methyl ester carboxylesterase [Paenibacillus sp. PastM-2]MDF9854638.1 pimeloyl-ACP methyl ester carboxylesterase [Paenibacillus sp. PastF-1]MDH6479754.1 pimeloyl-ACP methyl ester carboxylesterase [Paenibacillus sp. PastH-2]MDH6507344.1 pimeloyl-ACP methyl ester carboxylesterase [Paenibacillus sp. PastM-3]